MAHNLTQQNLQRQQRRINKDKRTQRAQYLAEHRQELIALLDAQRQERGATFLVNALTAFMNSHGGSLFRDEGGGLYLSMMDGNEIVVAKDPIQVHEDPDMDVVCKSSFFWRNVFYFFLY
jgi:hypothetical protein